MMITKPAAFIVAAIMFLFATSCQKEFSLDNQTSPGSSSGSAVYQFMGSPGNCALPVISGSYEAGTALDSSNKITLQVNVASIGTYQVSTGTANGIQFIVSDSFKTTGVQVITLQGSGIPLAGGSFNFSPSLASCTFTVSVTGTTPPVIGGTGVCKDCIYVPVCAGSKYSKNDTTMGIAAIKSSEYLAVTDTTIDGKTYQKVTLSDGSKGFFNCTNGETTAISYMATSNNGNVLAKLKLIMIKANAAVNTTWTENITNPIGQVVVQKFTIESKGTGRTVGTFNFSDVIEVSLETGIDVPPIGFMVAATTKYYYAKGVGLVETITIEPNSMMTTYHSVIKSYFIP